MFSFWQKTQTDLETDRSGKQQEIEERTPGYDELEKLFDEKTKEYEAKKKSVVRKYIVPLYSSLSPGVIRMYKKKQYPSASEFCLQIVKLKKIKQNLIHSEKL